MKTGKRSDRRTDFDPAIKAWMKAHTVGDLKDLASHMECKGEDASAVRDMVQALEGIGNGQLPWMGDS